MFGSLLPKSAPFFELLLEQNDILCQIAAKLIELLENHTNMDKAHREIAELERVGDNLHQAIIRHLSQSFITPIDREDILRINKTQEDAIDLLHNMANRLHIFEFSYIRFPLLQLSRNLKEMILLTRAMLLGLSKRKDVHNTRAFRTLRGDCEMLLSVGITELHDPEEPDSKIIVNILKWSQAYDRMELTVNQVVNLAETIEEAVLKNV